MNRCDDAAYDGDLCCEEDFIDTEAIKIIETLNLNRKKLYKNI
ncbi:MAG TPA: hypothetical protein PLD48_08680 [Bacillota bacterium]|nr:hypothetical protein [Bacillota bacterium]